MFAPLLLAIVVAAVGCEKYGCGRRSASARETACCGCNWARVDLFFGQVFGHTVGEPMYFRKTAFGATMSVAFLVALLGSGIMLYVNNVLYPKYAASVSPQPPPWDPNGEFELRVTVFGGGFDQDQCANGTANGFGVFATDADWSAPSIATNLYNPSDASCTLLWRCGNTCKLIAPSTTTLQLRSPPRSWASALAFEIRTPKFATGSAPVSDFGAAPFQLSTAFYSVASGSGIGSERVALRGPNATTVSLVLTPTIVNASGSVTTAVAFEPSLIAIARGNSMSFDAFNFSSADGFTVNFVLTRNTISLVLYVGRYFDSLLSLPQLDVSFYFHYHCLSFDPRQYRFDHCNHHVSRAARITGRHSHYRIQHRGTTIGGALRYQAQPQGRR